MNENEDNENEGQDGMIEITEELFGLYSKWIDERHTVYVKRGGKKAAKDARLFQAWAPAQSHPSSDVGVSSTAGILNAETVEILSGMSEELISDLYVNLGKEWKKRKKGAALAGPPQDNQDGASKWPIP